MSIAEQAAHETVETGAVPGVWDRTLEVVKAELNTPTFKTWFENTQPLGMVDDTFVVSVPNDFARDWIETRYAGLLRSALTQVTGRSVDVAFSVSADDPTAVGTDSPLGTTTSSGEPSVEMPDLEAVEEKRVKEATEGDFNPKYTFDSFVIGTSNRFAYAAALAVAESPGQAYNPLYIYGGVGLGKTHLLQAVGHYVQMHFPHKRVKYVSTEQFTNDFINSIGNRDNKRIDGFRRQYRTKQASLLSPILLSCANETTVDSSFKSLYFISIDE
jgi:chromosomal replication initiator protein